MTANTSSKVRFYYEIALAIAVYSIAALIFLGNALCSDGHLVIGNCESDVWKHLWGAWWMHSELGQGRFPIWTNLQNFPDGGKLYVIDPLNAICTSFTMPVLGLVTAFNLTQTLQLLAASLAAWGLTRWLLKDHRLALAAGFIYGFCPFMLSSGIASGIDETSNLAWLPLSIWGLLLCLNGERPPLAVVLGGCGLALSAIGSWYFGMTAAIFWMFILIWCAYTQKLPIPYASSINWLYPILAGMLAAFLALPLAVLFAQSLKGESSLLGHVNITERQEKDHLEFMYRTFDFKNNATLKSYLFPGKDQISTATDVDRRMKTEYIGFIALLLAGISLWKTPRQAIFWAIAALLFGVLSLGPYFAISPEIALSNPWSPVYLFAYYVVPGFRMVAICDRLSIGVQLSVAILAAMGIKVFLPNGWKGTALALLICASIATEIIYISPVPWPIPNSSADIPLVYKELASKKDRLGLICLPLNRRQPSLQPGEYYYWQTAHGKPLPGTLTTRFSEQMMENRLAGTLYLCADERFVPSPDATIYLSGLKELRESGFGWIVINGGIGYKTSEKNQNELLTKLLGKPQQFGEDFLYDLHSDTANRMLNEKSSGSSASTAEDAPK
ncbi:YfhO family protein [bacterium]|nr:YfhO family protein [bacterium]